MTRISDLSQDLIEEILSRVPLTSQIAVRSTCKQWNGLYKDESFTKKHRGKAANDTMVIMLRRSRVCLVSVDLQGVHKQESGLVELSTKTIGQLNRLNVSEVYHCDGLLLCIPEYMSMKPGPLVWNPYLGQVRWLKPRLYTLDRYCIGYDNKNNHKILRFEKRYNGTFEHEIYDFKSDSWRDLHVTPDWITQYCPQMGLSLKGNTYFVAQEREVEMRDYLICFDFTSERFRHCLDLESNSLYEDSVILSTVREEQLAVLIHRVDTYEIEIWITTKIEAEAANEVSLRMFLKVDGKPLIGRVLEDQFKSFLVDEKRKVALIWDNHLNRVYVIGKDKYFALTESTDWPVVCSYVPSSVQIRKVPVPGRGKRKLWDC